MTLTFTIPGDPVGKQRTKTSTIHGFVRNYTPKKTVNYETLVSQYFTNKFPGFTPIKQEIPLKMDIAIFLKIPSSISNKKREAMLLGKIRPTKKPDCSNVLKAVEDALNGVAFHDDSQIVDEHPMKFYSDRPRVEVVIREI